MKNKLILILIITLSLTMIGCKDNNSNQLTDNTNSKLVSEEGINGQEKIREDEDKGMETELSTSNTIQSDVEFSEYPKEICNLGFTTSIVRNNEYIYSEDGNDMSTVRFFDDGHVVFLLLKETKLVKVTESYKNVISEALKLALPTQYDIAYQEATSLEAESKSIKKLELDGKKVEINHNGNGNPVIKIYFPD